MSTRRTWSSRRLNRRQALRGAGVGLAGLSGAVLIGCGDSDDEATPTSSAGTPDASATSAGTAAPADTPMASDRGQGGTLQVALGADPTGLDPSTSRGGGDHHYLYSMFENLVNNGPDFSIKPGIATEWEVVDDLTVRFTTRNGFTYQDGTPFSTEDIKYTIERHQDPETQSYAAGQVGSIESVEVVDDSTVIVHLNAVTSPLFAILGDRAGMIMAQEPTEAAGDDFTNHPIGSGPFQLDNWEVDASVALSKFANYGVEGRPYLDEIDVQVVPNSSVQFANLRTGDADLIFVETKDREAARGNTDIQYHEWVGTGYTQVNTNAALFPNNDLRLRQAMTYSLNRQAVLDGIFFGEGELANGPMTKATWAYNENLDPIAEDLEKAKKLLDAAGYPDGIEFEMVIVADETRGPLAEMMKAQWARVGIDVTLVPRSSEEAGAEYRNQKYPMYLTFFSGRADPDMTIFENFHSEGSFNRVRYNEEYVPDDSQASLDAKIEAARQLYAVEERKPLYDEIQRQIVEDGLGVFFTHRTNAVGLTQRVQGFTPYGDGKLRLHELSLEA